jgi:hypothetical protein
MIKRINLKVGFVFLLLIQFGCNEKETIEGKSSIEEYCEEQMSVKIESFAYGGGLKSHDDSLRYNLIKKYAIYIKENKEKKKTSFPVFNKIEIKNMFLLSTYFNGDLEKLTLNEHYLLLIDIINDFIYNKASFNLFKVNNAIEIAQSTNFVKLKKDEKDSVYIGLNFYDEGVDIKNTYYNHNERFVERSNKFFVKIPSSKLGAGQINGYVRYFLRNGTYDSLDYKIDYIVE